MKNEDSSGLDDTLLEALRAQGAAPVSAAAKRRVLSRIDATLAGVGASGVAAQQVHGSSAASSASPAELAGQSAPSAPSAASVSPGVNGFVGVFGPMMKGLGIGVLLGSGALTAWLELGSAAHGYASATAVPKAPSFVPRVSTSVVAPSPIELSEPPPLPARADSQGADRQRLRRPQAERRPPESNTAQGLAGDDSALLETARSALARSQAQDALSALSLHRREFPGSAMTEEREALTIKALLASDQRTAAEAALASFAQRFPRSLFLPALHAALGDKQGS